MISVSNSLTTQGIRYIRSALVGQRNESEDSLTVGQRESTLDHDDASKGHRIEKTTINFSFLLPFLTTFTSETCRLLNNTDFSAW